MKTYVHYGTSEFKKEWVKPVKNRMYWGKPAGGFWGSDVNAEYGWKDWCKNEGCFINDLKKCLVFTLSNSARILEIHSVEDANRIIKEYPMPVPDSHKDLLTDLMPSIDWEKVAREYDAVEMFISDDWELYSRLPYWDCDSIVVTNPDVLIFLNKEKSMGEIVLTENSDLHSDFTYNNIDDEILR